MTMTQFASDQVLAETARASLWRNLTKWGADDPQGRTTKPVALLTAFVEQPTDVSGHAPQAAAMRLRLNRDRNRRLRANLATAGLSFVPVLGAGQSQRQLLGFPYVAATEEESFVVQPRGVMPEDQFLVEVGQILADYGQYAAAVKLPGDPMAFLLLQDGRRIPLGTIAVPRQPGEPFYTALTKGPRASGAMLDPWEQHGERSLVRRLINWFRGRADMNRPRVERGGQRFVIRNPAPRPRSSSDVQTS